MKKIIVGVIILLYFGKLASQSDNLQKVDAYLQAYYEKIPIPGFSIILVEDDKILFSKGYGVEKYGSNKPMTPNSALGIGAIGRGFTAMAVMQLVEQGLVDLDAPVTTYLPWFRTANKNLSDKITLRMCLSNTSGIPPLTTSVPTLDPLKALTPFVRSMESQFIQREPGLSHEFCDEGYSIAGLVISEITGLSFPAYLQKNIFAPLEMSQTTTDPKHLENKNTLHGHEMLIISCIPAAPKTVNGNYLPAGEIMYSSSKDLGNYLISLLNNGSFKGKQVLQSKSVQEIFKANTSFQGLGTMLGGNGIDIKYALGWMGMSIEDRDIMIHVGNTGTTAAIIGINIAQNQGFALLFNGDINRLDRYVYPNMENTANNITHLLNEEETTDFAIVRAEDPYDDDFTLPKADWEKYLGQYYTFGKTNSNFKDVRLDIFVGNSGKMELKAFKEKNIKGHYWLQFTNESRAVLRSIAHPREIQFTIYPNGSIGGLFMFGSEFKKRDPSISKRYSIEQSTLNDFSLSLPKSAKKVWNNNVLNVSFPNKPTTKLEIHVQDLIDQPFDTFIQDAIGNQPISKKGFIQKENLKDGIWMEQNIFIEQAGELHQFLIALYQAPSSDKQLQVVLSHPWGSFSTDLQEMMTQLQQSISF